MSIKPVCFHGLKLFSESNLKFIENCGDLSTVSRSTFQILGVINYYQS